MLTKSVAAILERDLRALRREVEAYPDERQIWQAVPGLPNTAGTLVLHLAGNLRHFVGARLGRTGYVRDRAAEFGRRDVPRAELLREIGEAERALGALATLDDGALAAEFPDPIGGNRVATGDFLVHLVAHCTFHLGQIDYHRRVVTRRGEGVGAVAIAELATARPAGG
jgi:uncharacterized damage-inducible protein DinB